MEDELIKFETAKLAKEKGFDLIVRYFYSDYSENKYIIEEKKDKNYNIQKRMTSAPTQSLLQKWLREVHNLDVIVKLTHGSKSVHYYPFIYDCNVHRPKEIDLYDVGNYIRTYEEALEKGLQEALKLINNI